MRFICQTAAPVANTNSIVLSDNDFLVRIRTNSTYYLQHTTDCSELNVLLYDGTHVLAGLLLCVWLRLTTLNEYDDDDDRIVGVGLPEPADVLLLLKDGDIAVAESCKVRGTTDACWTASNQRDTTTIRRRQISVRHAPVAYLSDAKRLKHLRRMRRNCSCHNLLLYCCLFLLFVN